jgi:uncharacterized protein
MNEKPLVFSARGQMLYGILHAAPSPATRGVLIVVGGPQTRVGSHRQFVLLARALAQAGIPCFRFDYTGMGDSAGPQTHFEHVDDDLRAAIERFQWECPDVKDIVLWGLCDAASAALFYAHQDPRIKGLVLANPWVRTEAGMAKAYLKTYYLQRLFSPELWQKIRRGQFDLRGALSSLLGMVRAAGKPSTNEPAPPTPATPAPVKPASNLSLPDRMAAGWAAFQGQTLFLLSGDDLTAAEFKDVLHQSKAWRKLWKQKQPQRHDLAEATHTFSRAAWRDQVATWTIDWVRAW